MKTKSLNGATEAYDFDIYSDEHIEDLGRLVANKAVVLVKQKLNQKRTWEVQNSWGEGAQSIVNRAVSLSNMGKHWASLRLDIFNVSSEIEPEYRDTMNVVTYQLGKKGRPKGLFANGALGWHSDQVAVDDGARVIGLVSVEHSENSQTCFLCTAEAYDKLSQEDRTMVDELQSVYKWNKINFTEDLIDTQKALVRYNQVPIDGMSCKLQQETSGGVKGIHFPGSLFSHFEGMTEYDSLKFKEHLWEQINKPEYIYEHNWQDGQVVYMDQNITLHARPTNIQHGNMRKMWRSVSYMNKLYPNHGYWDKFTVNGVEMDGNTFLRLVDEQRKADFEQGKKIAI